MLSSPTGQRNSPQNDASNAGSHIFWLRKDLDDARELSRMLKVSKKSATIRSSLQTIVAERPVCDGSYDSPTVIGDARTRRLPSARKTPELYRGPQGAVAKVKVYDAG